MSAADEIGKLAALKNQGVITEAEFEREKAKVVSGPQTKDGTQIWFNFVTFVLTAATLSVVFGGLYLFLMYVMPPSNCNSANTRSAIARLFNNSSYATQRQITATNVYNLERDLTASANDVKPSCTGRLSASNGSTYWIDVQWTEHEVRGQWIPEMGSR